MRVVMLMQDSLRAVLRSWGISETCADFEIVSPPRQQGNSTSGGLIEKNYTSSGSPCLHVFEVSSRNQQGIPRTELSDLPISLICRKSFYCTLLRFGVETKEVF